MQLKQKTKEILNIFKRFLITHKDILVFLSLVSLLGLILIIVSIANYYLLLNNKKTSPKKNLYLTEISTTYNTTNTSETNNFTLGIENSI